LVASAWLAVTVVYGHAWAAVLAAGIALLVAWSWFWIPLYTFRDDR
jgi:hypothetical protein